jgi:tRNA A-37 threonylcarbamoyl transferase component Bud32
MQLEPYKLATATTNNLYRIPCEGGFVLLKIYRPKRPRLRYEVRKTLHNLGWRQPVEYQSCPLRRDFERDSLLQWNAHGFKAPRPLDAPFPVDGVHLFMQWIEGRSVCDALHTDGPGGQRVFEQIITEMARRHGSGILQKDLRLFHIDSNCRNLIVTTQGIYHIDFEMGRAWESPLRHAERELMKFLVSVFNIVGRSVSADWIKRVRSLYPHTAVLELMRRNVRERPCQKWHQSRNARKKIIQGRATVYDIVEFL